jgi:superfamily II DNA helicase RecQ
LKVKKINQPKFFHLQEELEVLVQEVESGKAKRTIIFCPSIAATATLYNWFRVRLGALMFLPDNFGNPLAAKVNMMHSKTDLLNKKTILQALRESSSNLKVIIATSALALGVDTKGVHMVIHYEPPRRLADYIQEFGRAGRAMPDQCHVVLLYSTLSSRIKDDLKRYIQTTQCRRAHIFSHLNPDVEYKKEVQFCCDNCVNL